MIEHIFFSDEIGAGGISTNIVALSNYISRTVSKPIIVVIRDNDNSVTNYCRSFANVLSPISFFAAILKRKDRNYIFFVNSVRTLVIAYLTLFFLALSRSTVKIVFCTYNPWEFAQKGYWESAYRKLVFCLGKKNILFMNGACYEDHARNSPAGAIDSIFLPLVMPTTLRVNHILFNTGRRRILTVARFVGFKMHYIRQLLIYARSRRDVDFDLIGYGPGEKELRTYVESNNLVNVHFQGMVDYEKLSGFYSSADCYIGMGTTLVEAASAGTPTIVATAGVPGDICNGLFTDQKEYGMGEFQDKLETKPMLSLIDSVLALNQESFEKLSNEHQRFSQQFDISVVGPLYLKLCNSAAITRGGLRVACIWFGLCITTVAYFVIWTFLGQKSRYDKIDTTAS